MTVKIYPRGTDFARFAIARAVGAARNDFGAVENYAELRWGRASAPSLLAKAAAGSGGSTGWGAELVQWQSAASEFLGIVRESTIAGRLAGMRRIPPATPVLVASQKTRGAWVAEGEPVPVSASGFARQTLPLLKVGALIVVSEELLLAADPAAEGSIRDDLRAALAEAADVAFLDPANAGIPGKVPASITHGVAPLPATGDLKNDVETLVAGFAGDLNGAYFVGNPELFVRLAGPEWPNIGARGGDLAGIPAIASAGLPKDENNGFRLALIDPGGITYADDPAGTEIDVSTQGAIQMDDDPDAGAAVVALWQVGAVAIRCLMRANWRSARPGSVAMIDGIFADNEDL